MAKRERIVRATAEEINVMRVRGEIESNWAAAEALTVAEVECAADEDDGPLTEDWQAGVELGVPEAATPVHIRLDSSVVRWFKAQGRGIRRGSIRCCERMFEHSNGSVTVPDSQQETVVTDLTVP